MSLSNRKAISLLIIAGLLIAISPFLASLYDKRTLIDETGTDVDASSRNHLNDAYIESFTLEKDQKLIIEFSVQSGNVTVSLIIIGRGEYKGLDKVDTKPTEVSTKYNFLRTKFGKWEDPEDMTVTENEETLSRDGYAYIEFMGDVTNGHLLSITGEYKVIVFAREHPDGAKEVEFNIKMSLDGPYDPGDLIGFLFPSIGLLLIAYVGISSFRTLIKKWRAN